MLAQSHHPRGCPAKTTMPLITLEHSPSAYRADFALYGAITLSLALMLVLRHPAGSGPMLALWAIAGAVGWTLAEYLLHRFVLHGLAPFKHWHARHHQRPTALIGSPTLFSLALLGGFAAFPAWWLLGNWPATALSFGVIGGYLAYGLVHHATHHTTSRRGTGGRWLNRRRRWHALHHSRGASGARAANFGVTSSFWDHVFRTAEASVRAPLSGVRHENTRP